MVGLKKAVFLCNTDMVFNAFDEETLTKIRTRFELPNLVINSDDMQNHREMLHDAEYVFSTWGMPQLNSNKIAEYLPNLKAIFYGAGSVKAFAQSFLDCGVRIFSSWGANAIPVAEYTVAQIILANKGYNKVTEINRTQGRNAADNYMENFPGNYNTKVGILGAGMIGRNVMELLKNFKLDVLVYDPYMPKTLPDEYGATAVDIDTIFSQCRIISNHIANTPKTVGMLRYEHFSKMLPYATFINTGRGAQVVEQDLVTAMKECPTRSALLDVTYPEPPNADSPLLSCPNIYITPHIAGSMGNEVARLGLFMQQEAFRYLDNDSPQYEVVQDMLANMA